MDTVITVTVALALGAGFVWLFLRAGRRERAASAELAALRRELATADPARAREIRTVLKRHARQEAVARRELDTWRPGDVD